LISAVLRTAEWGQAVPGEDVLLSLNEV
jgi:hypothetical protein